MLGIIIPIGPYEEDWKLLIKNYDAPYKIYFAIGERDKSEFINELDNYKNIDYELISSAKGRANQQNFAAKVVKEAYLLFLHSDSVFNNSNFLKALKIIKQNDRAIWYHNLYFSSDSLLMKFTEIGVRIRCFLFSLPFGDQGLLLSKNLFLDIGGFPNSEIGEDLLMIRKAHKIGIDIKSLSLKIGTSARKYERNWLKTTFNHIYWTIKLFFKS